jgi:hypothetical protein
LLQYQKGFHIQLYSADDSQLPYRAHRGFCQFNDFNFSRKRNAGLAPSCNESFSNSIPGNLFIPKNQILPIYGTLIDTRHIKSFGKSKTYVLFMPLVYVPAIFLLSFMMVGLLDDVNPWPFFGIMMIVNLFVGTYWVSVDCWIPTLFPDNLKARGSYGRWFGLGKLFFNSNSRW